MAFRQTVASNANPITG